MTNDKAWLNMVFNEIHAGADIIGDCEVAVFGQLGFARIKGMIFVELLCSIPSTGAARETQRTAEQKRAA